MRPLQKDLTIKEVVGMLLLDTMVLSELRKRNRNPAVVASFRPRILPINTAIARRWGQLSTEIGHSGADLMLAATALEHGMHVVTRNERHVLPTGVGVVNPFRRD